MGITIFETILWCIFRVVLWFINHELVVKHNTACNIVCLLAYQVNRMYGVYKRRTKIHTDTSAVPCVHCTAALVYTFILPVCDTPDYFGIVTISISISKAQSYTFQNIHFHFQLIHFNLYSSARRFRFSYSI